MDTTVLAGLLFGNCPGRTKSGKCKTPEQHLVQAAAPDMTALAARLSGSHRGKFVSLAKCTIAAPLAPSDGSNSWAPVRMWVHHHLY